MKYEISTFYKDDGHYCVVYKSASAMYSIDYYAPAGNKIHEEHFPVNSLAYVEDAAENWALGIKKLNTEE